MATTFDPADVSNPGHYGPSQTALLLLDFHSMFVQKVAGPQGPSACATAAEMRKWAKAQGIHVIHGLIDVDRDPFPTCKGRDGFGGIAKTMKATGGDVEAAELREGGSDDDGSSSEVRFTRRPGYVSALKSPGLLEYLEEKGIKSLVITGLSTSGCVNRTSLAACDAEYVVTVLSDGCADGQQDVHDLMVGKILNNRGHVFTAAEFRDGFEKAVAGK